MTKGLIIILVSKLIGERYKENPKDANLISHIFMLRGGYIRQVSNGIYSMLLPAKKVAMKIEQIIREEMDKIDGQEVLMPVVMPAELWKESGRYDSVGNELVRFKDRTDHDMVLGMTHEEAAVHLARNEATSYTKYPFMIYQIQTKFRDEPRSRGGLIRVREFTMKDAYSFHTSQEDLEEYYNVVHESYHKIFARAGIPQVISVGSDTGMMGGSKAHEFMFLSDAGEDSIVICESCGYKANMEVAEAIIERKDYAEQEMEEVFTPDIKDIKSLAAFLNVSTDQTMKATVFAVENRTKPLVVFIRGDLEVNEAKLKKIVKANIFPYENYEDTDLCFGFIGAYGLDNTKVDIVFDASLKGAKNLVGGANKKDYHIKGINIARDIGEVDYYDVAKVRDGDTCVKCGQKLVVHRGIEVGNIFQLGTKYTESMNMTYTDEDGKKKNPIMGCYGIGVGRLLACVIEASHDENGPIWPVTIAPWQIHICTLNAKKEEIRNASHDLYNKLKDKYEVILDDRNVTAGIQFADADLLGVPIRLIVSKRNIENGQVEVVTRDKSFKQLVNIEDVEKVIEDLLKQG